MLNSKNRPYNVAVVAVGLVVFFPHDAEAYIGPGSGLSAFGSLFAILAAVIFGLVGFVWYPLRRLIRLVCGTAKDISKKE